MRNRNIRLLYLQIPASYPQPTPKTSPKMAAPTFADALRRTREMRQDEVNAMTLPQLKRAFFRVGATADLRTAERDLAHAQLEDANARATRLQAQLNAANARNERQATQLANANAQKDRLSLRLEAANASTGRRTRERDQTRAALAQTRTALDQMTHRADVAEVGLDNLVDAADEIVNKLAQATVKENFITLDRETGATWVGKQYFDPEELGLPESDDEEEDNEYHRTPENTRLPAGMPRIGIDVPEYQDFVDWLL